jgi:hypothetical protein
MEGGGELAGGRIPQVSAAAGVAAARVLRAEEPAGHRPQLR